ncbi:MAG: hypothetical protein IPG17_20525 [Sandaracinaceae bacterium]|jgi:hypothetical protein|nr:hypothetical protein [Sandaracinaceae bacterium]MBP7683647.1 hypothetical protein [Deltaproteobacteria bacterium]MBK6808842.1 hypothetical protein [Sandaracinaceae bacterium]MBK7150412.1 hypothetical protein [Sandaracinaceae bacterium]MBK7777250.1 hypothetical protein [Sandaracinaceae bacterium]
MSGNVEIREHRMGLDLEDFIRVQYDIFRNDPAYIPPLEMELRDRLTPGKNPLFEHAEGTLFTAWRGGKLVGRCSAQIDREHLRVHQDETGFFGFLDTIDDADVAHRLLASAESWLKARGMKRVRGPFSLTINEESGVLIDGFEHPPVLMMPHSTRYQAGLIESYGYEKVQDLYAWKYVVAEPPPRAAKAHADMMALPEVRFRSVDKSRMRQEVDTLVEIFNDAWSENWGFVPATEAEVAKMAQDFKLLLDPDLAFFAEVEGREVGMVVCIPNLNEAARDLNGKLFPFGWAKLLYRLKVKGTSSARLVLLGLRKDMRAKKRYGALSTAMYAELAYRGMKKPQYKWAELSWTLEDNRPINLGIKAMRAQIYKTYRVYEKAL